MNSDHTLRRIGIPIALTFGLLLIGAGTACKKAAAPESAAGTPDIKKAVTEVVPKGEFIAVLGQADAQNSGVFEVTPAADQTTINYHFYTLTPDSFAKDFPTQIAPKIRDLFAKIKSLEQAAFDVSIPTQAAEVWKPKAHFVITRKLIVETDWTKLLDADFFQIVQDLKLFD
jgi:hypothetical protein